jgi:hypothetical protein
VRNPFIAAAVLSWLATSAAYGAEGDELGEVREQLKLLLQRVDRLESENVAIKAENETLKNQADYLKSETRGLRKETAAQASELAKVKGADWASKIALKGDLRYRYERISDETRNSSGALATADRYRDRVRARLNVEVKATDTINVGLGFATTEGGDPRSSNQTLSGVFSRKSLDLDLAYFDWKFANWGALIGGKMKQPFYKPGQSLFWDNDVNPEGLAVKFSRGIYFGTVYNYWLNEVSGAQTALTADAMLAGAQIGAKVPLGASSLTLAAQYYDLSAGKGRAPFYNGNANGNTTVSVTSGTATTAVLANDYRVANLSAELATQVGQLPLQVWADFAQNGAVDDYDTAWGAGILLGKASSYRTWEVGVSYQVIEKDALFAQLIDSDFAGGASDGRGFVFRAGYAPMRNWVINATYLMNERNVDVANSVGQTGVDYDRLQLDFNVKF